MIATVPVMTALLACFVYKEKLHTIQWIAIIIEFAGVAALTLMDGIFTINLGLVWLLFAALALSIYNLLQRKLTKTYTALQTSTYSIFIGTLMLAIFAPTAIQEIRIVPEIQFVYLGILGICSSAIAYVSWAKAFTKAKQTSLVSNYMFITPFLTSILGFFIAGEIPDYATLFGGSIILTGVFIFNFGEKLYEKFYYTKN